MNVLIWGAGAIGGTLGAYFSRAGHDVTFVDIVPEHVAAIDAAGLRITGPVDTFTVTAKAYTPERLAQAESAFWECIVLCVKAHHTVTATQALRPFLADNGYVVSAQNGLNEHRIAEIVGPERTVGCFVNFGADYLEPGVIHFGGRGAVVLGELDGRASERLQALHDLFLTFDPNAVSSDNIWGYLWSKLAYGALLFATATGNDSIADALAKPAHHAFYTALAREVLAVALAVGVTPEAFDGFDPSAFLPSATRTQAERSLRDMVAFNRKSAKTHSGIWRDLAVRKRKTEAEAQLGAIVEQGRAAGMATPLTASLLELIRQLEAGELEQGPAALELLAAQAATGAKASDAAPEP